MHFIYLYILLYFNSLSFYIPIACQSFRYIFYVFGISLYLYFFCIPISMLYISYTYHVHFSRLSYVFSMFLFFFGSHIMSLVYVFFIFRFYDLLHSMYYYIYFTYLCTFLFYHILCAFVYFLYLSCVDLKSILSYHISIFRIT